MGVQDDLRTIQQAVEREGVVDASGCVVVPDDFFRRLDAQLNPPRQGPSIIDLIIEACDRDKEDRAALTKAGAA